jgi:hypothetical protein
MTQFLVVILAVIGALYLAATLFYIFVKLGWYLEVECWLVALYIRLYTYIFEHEQWKRWRVSDDPVKKFWWERD